MNSTSIDFEYFIDCDNSPFVIFSNAMKVIYLNRAAEILMGYVQNRELYTLAITHAPQDIGSKTTLLDLKYGSFIFHSITVAYQDEEHIAIRLYNKPIIKNDSTMAQEKLILTDINTIMEANLTLFKMYNSCDMHLLTDTDLPSFKVDQNQLSKLIRDSLDSFKNNNYIMIHLSIVIGESIRINDKRHQILQIRFQSDKRNEDYDQNIKTLSQNNYVVTMLEDKYIKINIPMITD
ncbi:MAG: hypothetical protein KU38_04725 [Sulfurovum sp. FS08-3]|nr:MAG: hypothetical protein KU38_04725 [Sulfurovum sp. FS08-3]